MKHMIWIALLLCSCQMTTTTKSPISPTTLRADESPAVSLEPSMTPPKKIPARCPPPAYPRAARGASMQGKVIMKITVNTDGVVLSAQLIEGDTEFIEAARNYLLKCGMTPAMSEGQPIAITKTEVVNFRLR